MTPEGWGYLKQKEYDLQGSRKLLRRNLAINDQASICEYYTAIENGMEAG